MWSQNNRKDRKIGKRGDSLHGGRIVQTTIEFGRDVDEAQGGGLRQAGGQSALSTWGFGNDQLCDGPALKGGLIVGIACDCGDVEWLRLQFRWGFEGGIGRGCGCTEERYDGYQNENGGDHGGSLCVFLELWVAMFFSQCGLFL